MPAARGVKRTASKASAAAAASGPKNKKKRNVIQLEIPTAPRKRGRVLTCGQGDVGQLGLGEDIVETTRFKHVAALGDKIVDACAGGMHTIALDSDGKVWTFGCNDEGALGRATSGESDEGTPKTVTLPLPAVAVAAGDSHSAALLNNGDVYAWGAFRDSHGSMGLVVRGREGKSCRDPVKVDIGEQAAAVASGGDHLVILSTSGAVYTMGCGEQGQLGRLAQRSASRDTRQGFSALLVPSKVTLKAGASRIWAGYHATFVLDASGEKMFAWGLNNYGQLGITGEKRRTALFSPGECDAFAAAATAAGEGEGGARWAGVACGQHHSLARSAAGRVYAVGRCEYGRLGLGDRTGDAEVLEPIPKLQNKKCISIAAGTSNSFAVTDSGEILAWGMGSEGQLGTGSSADAAEPTPAASSALADRKPIHVSAGGQHTVLLVEDPSALKEASPAPERETAEQKADDKPDEVEPEVEKKPKGRQTKRQRKQEQEEEISSTSSAQASEVGDSKPQKINGDEKKEAPMEVDETDNSQETKGDTKPQEKSDMDDTASQKEESKPETTDTSSQDTVDSDAQPTEAAEKPTEAAENPTEAAENPTIKVADSEKATDPAFIPLNSEERDVEMKEDRAEINGTPETPVVEPKTVENMQSDTLTTTA